MNRPQRFVLGVAFTALIFVGAYFAADHITGRGVLGLFRGPFDLEYTWYVWVGAVLASAALWVGLFRDRGGGEA
jgi:hypothetical protein